MPIYEYHCKSCGKEFEQVRRMEDHPSQCPFCNTINSVELLISVGTFQLTGTGWYKTDYK